MGVKVHWIEIVPPGRVTEEEWNEFYGMPDVFKGLENIPEWSNLVKPAFIIFNPYLIHGISYYNGKDIDPTQIISNLRKEFQCYEKNHFDVRNHTVPVTINYTDSYVKPEFNILQTPYNWNTIKTVSPDVEYDFSDETEVSVETAPKQPSDNPTTIRDLINLGESKTREFKPAIFYNYKTKSVDSGFFCAKPICAFLNSEGGYLFVGVKDDKSLQGVDDDFSIILKDDKRDGLLLKLSDMIDNFFQPFVHDYLQADFYTDSGKTILVIRVNPSDKPVFMKEKQSYKSKKLFFIREFANNKQLYDIEDITHYVSVRWFKKSR